MINLPDNEFEQMVSEAIDNIPDPYKKHLENVAFLIEDEPSDEQRTKLELLNRQTLLGLYEGVPLPQRNGSLKLLPDKITLFKVPLLQVSNSKQDLERQIAHTVWHEVAHFYGLDHGRIEELESK